MSGRNFLSSAAKPCNSHLGILGICDWLFETTMGLQSHSVVSLYSDKALNRTNAEYRKLLVPGSQVLIIKLVGIKGSLRPLWLLVASDYLTLAIQ